MPPRSAKAAKARDRAAGAGQQAALVSSVADHFKTNYMDDTDPTGPVWGGLRPYLTAQYKVGFKVVSPEAPDLPLFNVYDFPGPVKLDLPATCSALSAGRGSTQKQWPLAVALPAEGSQRRDFASIDDFKEQLSLLTLGAFKHVDFAKHKAIVAGGVVEACLRAPEPGSSTAAAAAAMAAAGNPRAAGDADVFFYGTQSWNDLVKNATAVGAAVVRGLRETPGVETVRLERRTGTLNIVAQDADGAELGRPVQLVLLGNTPASASRVLHHFDLDSAQFGWAGGAEVVATWKGLRAWMFQANVVDVEHIMASHRGGRILYGSLSCEDRLFKYWKRGYTLAVPGLTAEALAAAHAEVAATAPAAARKLLGLPRLLWTAARYDSLGEHRDRPFMLDALGAGGEKVKAEAEREGWDAYRTKPLDPEAAPEEAVHQLVDPIPSEPWAEAEDLPWVTRLSALAYQKSWASGKEDGITAGIRPPEGDCVIT